MASGPITLWQIDRENVETMTDFIFLSSKITADGDYSHKINRCSLLGRKAMTNLDSVLKSRNISLPTKICIVKVMVFPVVMHRCESWTKKKAQLRRIDALELWCWRRLETPLDSKEFKPVNPKGNQSWIFTGRTDAEAETPVLWPPDAKSWFIRKDSDARKDRRQEEKGPQRMRWLNDITDLMDMSLSKPQEIVQERKPGMLQSMGSQSQRRLSNWTTTTGKICLEGQGLLP